MRPFSEDLQRTSQYSVTTSRKTDPVVIIMYSLPRLVYFLTHFGRPFLCFQGVFFSRKLCHYLWLLCGFLSSAGYDGARTVLLNRIYVDFNGCSLRAVKAMAKSHSGFSSHLQKMNKIYVVYPSELIRNFDSFEDRTKMKILVENTILKFSHSFDQNHHEPN